MEFEVNFIATNPVQSEKARESLDGNCTKVSDNLYIFEGDLGVLLDDEVSFNLIDAGVVGSLGGLSSKELMEVCHSAFSWECGDLDFKIENEYKE